VLGPQAAPLHKAPSAPKELGERDSGTRARQIDGPHVVQRHAREKRVDSQGKPFELLVSDLRLAVTSGRRVEEKRSAKDPQCRVVLVVYYVIGMALSSCLA
jgi:hypothetical protein